MKKIKTTGILLLLFFSALSVNGQNCTHYHIENCRWAGRSFFYSRQSRSASFLPGMTSTFRIVVYGGEEYYISVDGHRKLGDLRLRIYDDSSDEKPLYDNARFKYEEYFYFQNSRTRDLLLEVTSENPKVPEEERSGEKYCLGVLIEFKSTSQAKDPFRDSVGF